MYKFHLDQGSQLPGEDIALMPRRSAPKVLALSRGSEQPDKCCGVRLPNIDTVISGYCPLKPRQISGKHTGTARYLLR